MKHEPGPWFSEPWWRKAYLWTVYVLALKPRNLWWMAHYLWTYHVALRALPVDGHHDKHPDSMSIAPCPRIILPIMWRMEGAKAGRYYRLVFPENVP